MTRPAVEPTADGGDHRKTVVVLRALGLGDMCTAVPALRALRRAFPDRRIVLAGDPVHQVIAGAVGVDEVVPTRPLGALPDATEGAALAVNLHGRGPESTRTLLDRHPSEIWAFHHPDVPETTGGPRWPGRVHEVVRWCRLLQHHGVDADATDVHLGPPAPPGPDRRGVVVVHPGADAPARRWPPDRFAAVVRVLIERGRRVVLTGGAEEVDLCWRIRTAAGGGEVLAGRTTLDELCAIVAHAALVVSNDTGVAHLATAYATRSVVLFGPSAPSEWGPITAGPHRVLWGGGRGDPHGEVLDPGLASIRAEEVHVAARQLLAARDPGSVHARG